MKKAQNIVRNFLKTAVARSRFLKRVSSAATIQKTFRGCSKPVFALKKNLRKSQANTQQIVLKYVPGGQITCPITNDKILEPVLNMCDNKLYTRCRH